MNLAIFFEPLPEEFEYPSEDDDQKLAGAHVERFIYKFPNWQDADLAIFSVDEDRGKAEPLTSGNPANIIRKKLYSLKKGTGRYRICDLGNMRPGITLEETRFRIREVVETLISQNTLPIILGASHDLDYGQFMAYETWGRGINMVMVDSDIDMDEDRESPENRWHLHKIMMHDPNYMFSFSQIGYQSYLVDQEMINTLEKVHFEMFRIGQIHTNIQQIEPVLRYADMVSFDLAAIRFQDCPGYSPPNPFGLSGEQACQICWYAGLNDQLSSFGLYEYDHENDHNGLGASVAATMVWYFIEGYYNRKQEIDFTSRKFTKYAVAYHDNPHKIVFYKSNVSDKWWMEVENLTEEMDSHIVPCAYEDYVLATTGEIPNRWILTQARMG